MNLSLLFVAAAFAVVLVQSKEVCKETSSPNPKRGGIYRVPGGTVTRVKVSKELSKGKDGKSVCTRKTFGICHSKSCIYAKRPCQAKFKYCFDPETQCFRHHIFGYQYIAKYIRNRRRFMIKKVYRTKEVRYPIRPRRIPIRVIMRFRRGRRILRRIVRRFVTMYPKFIELLHQESGNCVKGETYTIRGRYFVIKPKCMGKKYALFTFCYNKNKSKKVGVK